MFTNQNGAASSEPYEKLPPNTYRSFYSNKHKITELTNCITSFCC